jgi:hypothetical protein
VFFFFAEKILGVLDFDTTNPVTITPSAMESFNFSSLNFTGEPITSNWSRFVLAPWFFVILIVSASFTASLTSRMTVSQFEPSVLDIETLQTTNAMVGV